MTIELAIIGASGQDGRLIGSGADRRGWSWSGTSRQDLPQLRQVDPCDDAALRGYLRHIRPRRIVLLAGQSSVGESIRHPEATIRSHVEPLKIVLDWMASEAGDTRLVYAASGECFGPRRPEMPAREDDVFAPINPYGTAKSIGADLLRQYRQRHALHASNAFLFSHESPARSSQFVFGKILAELRRLRRAPDGGAIVLGSLDVVRDWGWAEDYCEAMIRMSDNPAPADLILATGHSVSLREAVHAMVTEAGFDPHRVVRSDPDRFGHAAANDAHYADPSRARAMIDWQGSTPFPALAGLLLGQAG